MNINYIDWPSIANWLPLVHKCIPMMQALSKGVGEGEGEGEGEITCYILSFDCLSIAYCLPSMPTCSALMDMGLGPYPLGLSISASRASNRQSMGKQ